MVQFHKMHKYVSERKKLPMQAVGVMTLPDETDTVVICPSLLSDYASKGMTARIHCLLLFQCMQRVPVHFDRLLQLLVLVPILQSPNETPGLKGLRI
jgi:hypothetical protein